MDDGSPRAVLFNHKNDKEEMEYNDTNNDNVDQPRNAPITYPHIDSMNIDNNSNDDYYRNHNHFHPPPFNTNTVNDLWGAAAYNNTPHYDIWRSPAAYNDFDMTGTRISDANNRQVPKKKKKMVTYDRNYFIHNYHN